MPDNELESLHKDFNRHVELEEVWKKQNEIEHSRIETRLDEHGVKLDQIKLSQVGRERYEQGIKHGITTLWALIVAGSSAILAWIMHGSGKS